MVTGFWLHDAQITTGQFLTTRVTVALRITFVGNLATIRTVDLAIKL
jgi:hypothetical protein